jgi:ATP-dependent helicase HepA
VTFDRKKALSREDLSFLSWDHPIVSGTIDMILSSGKGAVSYGALRSDEQSAILLEFMFVVETIGGKSLNVDRFLPSTPIRLVIDHTGRRVTKLYPSEDLEQNLVGGDHDEILENESFEELMFPKMMSEANIFAEKRVKIVISDSVKIMKMQLGYEISRLNSLSKKNSNIRPEELEQATLEMSSLEEIMQNAQVRVDAMRLIKVG